MFEKYSPILLISVLCEAHTCHCRIRITFSSSEGQDIEQVTEALSR